MLTVNFKKNVGGSLVNIVLTLGKRVGGSLKC